MATVVVKTASLSLSANALHSFGQLREILARLLGLVGQQRQEGALSQQRRSHRAHTKAAVQQWQSRSGGLFLLHVFAVARPVYSCQSVVHVRVKREHQVAN